MTALEVFRRQLVAWDLPLPSKAEDLLQEYALLLCSYDRANVIGTREFDRVLLDHVLDSLSCLLFSPVKYASRICDVGSGGGLPSVPLAIALPGAAFTLIESVGKKAAFLRHAAESLDLRQIEVVNERAEDTARDPAKRARQNVCTVRAVATLPTLAEYCLPLLEVGGYVVAMKGRVSEEELRDGERAARLLGGYLLQTIEVPLLAEMEQKARQLVVLQKTASTPEIYPRRAGLPAKRPLAGR